MIPLGLPDRELAHHSLNGLTMPPAFALAAKFQNGLWETSAMWIESENALMVLSFAVQVMGIGGVLLARCSASKGKGRPSVMLSLVCFLVVGVLSLMLMRTCTGSWLAFATTMPLMAVGATLDLKKGTHRAEF